MGAEICLIVSLANVLLYKDYLVQDYMVHIVVKDVVRFLLHLFACFLILHKFFRCFFDIYIPKYRLIF